MAASWSAIALRSMVSMPLMCVKAMSERRSNCSACEHTAVEAQLAAGRARGRRGARAPRSCPRATSARGGLERQHTDSEKKG